MLQVVEVILEDELVRPATTPMNSRCSSSKSMSNNRFVGLHVNNLNTVVKEDMAWVVAADQPLGRGCMMMFRNQTFPAAEAGVEGAAGGIKEVVEVEVQGDLLRHKVDLKVLRLLTHQLDRRMLASQVRTTVVVVEVVTGAFTLMLGAESCSGDAFFTSTFYIALGRSRNGFGASKKINKKIALWSACSRGVFINLVQLHCIAERTGIWVGFRKGNSAAFSGDLFSHAINQ